MTTTLINDRDTLLQGAVARTTVSPTAAVLVVPSSPGFHVSADGTTHSPASIVFTASLVGLTGPITFSCVGGTLSSQTANTATLLYADMSAAEATVTAKVTVNGQDHTNTCKVSKVQDGTNGTNGNNVGTFYAYKRAAAAPTDNPGNVTVDFTTGQITTATLANGWSKTIPAANGNPLYVEVISGSAAGTTASLLASGWSGASALAQDGAQGQPGNTGPAGLNVATVQVYQRTATATAPALPSATTTYTFATGVLTGLNNGWSQSIPAATSDKPYLQSTLATASATTATDDIAASEWAAAQVVVQDGLDGTFSRKDAWEFRNTLDGWTFNNANVTQNADSVTVAATTNDPIAASPTLNLDGSRYDKLRARIRRTAGSTWQGDLYYTTSSHSTWSETYKINAPDPTIGGAWVTVEWDMSGVSDWKSSTITEIRLDLGNSAGDTFEIDWIATGKVGPVNLPDLGQHAYRVVTAGSAVTSPPATIGVYLDGVAVGMPGPSFGRSYTVATIDRGTGMLKSSAVYDVYGDPANATAMANALNALDSTEIVLVASYDEPQSNRLLNGLDTAMYRCGASRIVYGSPNFKYRSGYVLIGIPGCGEGNGYEAYQGKVDSDTNAWVDVAFSVYAGSLTGVTAQYTPTSLTDYNYTGDLNATNGANASNLNISLGGDNLTYNSSFEKMTNGLADGWNIYNNDSTNEPTTASSTTGRTGGVAQVISWSNNHQANKGINGSICKPGWLPNSTYIVSFWAKTSSLASGGNMMLAWNTPPNSVTALSNPYLSADWQLYSFKLVWGATVDSSIGPGSGFISVSHGTGAGNVIFDDFMVVEGDFAPIYYPSASEAATLAQWANIAGQANAPENNATHGATWGSNIGGQPADSSLLNSYISLGADGTLSGAGGGQVTNLPTIDTRNDNTPPSGYGVCHIKEFKDQAAVGIPGSVSGTYCVVETVKGWVNNSGGNAIQWAYIDSGTVWKRSGGNADTSWGAWVRDLDRALFTGDLNATNGAPAGSNVGSTPATTVESNAASGASASTTLNNKPVVNAGADVTVTSTMNSTSVTVVNNRTATISGGNGALTGSWSVNVSDTGVSGKGKITITQASGASVWISASGVSGDSVYGSATYTATDTQGLTGADTFNIEADFL